LAGFIGLGSAANYTLFDVRNTQFQFNNSFVGGDVGLGAGTTYNISGGGGEAITGNVFYSPSHRQPGSPPASRPAASFGTWRAWTRPESMPKRRPRAPRD
jgi:hypothetical protein